MSKFADVTFQEQRGFVADVKAWKERGVFGVKVYSKRAERQPKHQSFGFFQDLS